MHTVPHRFVSCISTLQVGPYANPAVAARVYEKAPVGDFLECSITAAFLVTAKILSLVGFSDFTPNNF